MSERVGDRVRIVDPSGIGDVCAGEVGEVLRRVTVTQQAGLCDLLIQLRPDFDVCTNPVWRAETDVEVLP